MFILFIWVWINYTFNTFPTFLHSIKAIVGKKIINVIGFKWATSIRDDTNIVSKPRLIKKLKSVLFCLSCFTIVARKKTVPIKPIMPVLVHASMKIL